MSLSTTVAQVGINTTNPLAGLHIVEDSNSQNALFSQITVTNSNLAAGIFLNPNTSQGFGGLGIGYNGIYGLSTNSSGWAGFF